MALVLNREKTCRLRRECGLVSEENCWGARLQIFIGNVNSDLETSGQECSSNKYFSTCMASDRVQWIRLYNCTKPVSNPWSSRAFCEGLYNSTRPVPYHADAWRMVNLPTTLSSLSQALRML